MRAFAFVLTFALAGSVAAHEREVCRDLRPARLEVLALDRLHSALSGALGYERGFVPLLADDVLLLVPGQPILEGKAAARQYFATLDPAERLTWTPTRIDAAVDGALGTQWGWTSTTNGATAVPGKNISVWKRTAAGWRVAVYLQAGSGAPKPTPPGFGLFPDEKVRCAALVDPSVTTGAIEDTDVEFAADSVANGFGPAFGDFAAPDAVVRSAGLLFIGPDAIHALFGDTPPDVEVLDWAPTNGGAARSNDLGWTVGTATDTVIDPSGNLVFFSKYVTLWKKQPDGTFKYVADAGNDLPPPTE
jgi:ketosteroid isomerase-like protein